MFQLCNYEGQSGCSNYEGQGRPHGRIGHPSAPLPQRLFLVDERPTNDFDWLIEDPGPVLSVFGKDEKQTRQSKNDSFFDCRVYFRLRGFLISGNLAFSVVIRNHIWEKNAEFGF